MSESNDAAQLRTDILSLRDHETRCEQLLKGTVGLPSLDELVAGYPFMGDDAQADLRCFVDSELLDTKMQPELRTALELAKTNPTGLTLRAASDAAPRYTDLANRMSFYAFAWGDPTAIEYWSKRFLEGRYTIDLADGFRQVAIGMHLATTPGHLGVGSKPVTIAQLDNAVHRGTLVMQVVGELYTRRMEALKGKVLADAGTRPKDAASPKMASALSAIAAMQEDRAEIHGIDVEEDGIPDEFLGEPPGPPKEMLVVPAMDMKSGTSHARDLKKGWTGLAGQRLPLVQIGDVAGIAADLSSRWPHARDLIHVMIGDLALGGPVRFKPTLLVGPAGSGKTALMRAVADACGLTSEAYAMAGQSDASLMGTSAQWSNARESVPLQLIKKAKQANVAVIWDELEKVGTRRDSGNPLEALLPYLEHSQAKRLRDLALEVEVNLSMVSHFATANSMDGIPAPLKDRMRVLRMPEPTWEHLGTLTKQIVDDLARERGVDPRWYPPLAEDEMDVIRQAWTGGSLRQLKVSVQVMLDGRDQIMGRA